MNYLADTSISKLIRLIKTEIKEFLEHINIADGTVSRNKLAQDALYSPFYAIGPTDTPLTLEARHIGQKIRLVNSSTDYVINVNKNSAIPTGAEFAIVKTWAKSAKIFFTDAYVYIDGETNYLTNPVLALSSEFSTIALEKISSDSEKDYWHVIGAVEVAV